MCYARNMSSRWPPAPLTNDAQPGGRRGRRRRADDLQDGSAGVVDDVQLAVGVGAEGAHVALEAELAGVLDKVGRRGFAGRGIDIERKRPHTTGLEIAQEVPALMGSAERAAPIDESAGNRLARGAGVFEDRIDQRQKGRRPRRDVVVRPLAVSPAVVPPAPAPRLVIDLFEAALTDVAHDERARAAKTRIVE